MKIDSNWNQLSLTVGDAGDRKGRTIRMGDKSTESYGLAPVDSTPLLKLNGADQTDRETQVNDYLRSMQEGLGLSDADIQAIRDDLDVRYSLEDLKAAGMVAGLYRGEQISASMGSRNEATLALGLAMADLKTEALIGKGLVSEDMAALLRGSRQQAHQMALSAADQRLAERESSRLPGEPKGAFARLDRELFVGIYQATIDAGYGGDVTEAVRAGVDYGREATARAHAKNPAVFRWGNSMEQYWKNFYTTPEPRKMSQLDKQVENLMLQVGQTSNRGCSTYQTYVNGWHDFMNAIGVGVDVRG